MAVARWCIGMILLCFGIAKLVHLTGFVNDYLLPLFGKTILPNWLLIAYGYAMPFLEVGMGALLIVGLWRNGVLFLTELYLMSLAFGQILLRTPILVSANTIYVFMVGGLLFLGDYDRWIWPRPRLERTTFGD